MRRKIVIALLGLFVVAFVASRILLRRWTEDFDLVTSDYIFHGAVDNLFVNGRYVYVWSGQMKYLLPSAITEDGQVLLEKISRNDILIKESEGNELFLVKEGDTLIFKLE